MTKDEGSKSLSSEEPKGPLDSFLSIFAEVKGGEGLTALVLTLDVFLLLVAYYLLKTVREPLILQGGGGVVVKSYATSAQAVLLMAFVPCYALLTARLSRIALVTATLLFFASNLALFFVLALFKVPYLGVAFFLWLGCFSLTVIAQFWSFASDVYTPEQGKRLFAIVGVGGSVGAVGGSLAAKQLIGPVGPFPMMLIAAGVLLVCLALTRFVNAREDARAKSAAKPAQNKPIGGKNGFSMIVEDKYLLLMGGLILLLNFVNTCGEAILDMNILAAFEAQAPAGLTGEALEKARGTFIGEFRADFFFWVNLIGAVFQMFFVSRIFKYVGVRAALFSLPIIGLVGYGLIAVMPSLKLVRLVKIAENACDYSLYNTTKQALWLPTSRAQKYNAKMAIDTFIVRLGDFVAGLAVPAGIALGLIASQFAMVNLVLIAAWCVTIFALRREHKKRTDDLEAGEATSAAKAA